VYFRTSSDQFRWAQQIRKQIGLSKIQDFFTLDGSTIGQGQFGKVLQSTHIETGERVALKTARKRDMKIVEIYQSRREIDILKMCQHPNIIRLIDYFENESYHFIVLEHCKGKNLYDYL
jgi:serine/threonine protein kinase